jgi:CubicO group peptidase (beta-lactamase class C family)
MTIVPRTLVLLPLALALGGAPPRQADPLDALITAELAKRHVPGLSIAIIDGGKIVRTAGYGVIEKDKPAPVTTATLFQAGSISKSVAAVAALHLVEAGTLSLDEDVNAKLTGWKVPENRFTTAKKVTLRSLLSHSAGLTVHGFPGYDTDSAMPTLVQVLDGARPANTAAIRVDTEPGAIWRYSGGGYTVMQQMIIDVTGQPFPRFMERTVLAPFGMTASSYQQPPPADRARATATGHYDDRTAVRGRWHVYPEMAAAGLWTTPSDLARFAIAVQQSFAGTSNPVLSQAMTRQMLTDQKAGDGLGVFLAGSGATLQFSHNGRDEGFDALMIAWAEGGRGVVIMINANDNSRMMGRIVAEVAREYHWPPPADAAPPPVKAVPVAAALLRSYAGRYERANNQMVTFVAGNGRLFTRADGFADEEFVPEADDRFASTERDFRLTFKRDSTGQVTDVIWKMGERGGTAPRVGPLIASLARQSDPDPALTSRIEATLRGLARGGAAMTDSAHLTAGAIADFGTGGYVPLAGLRTLGYVAGQDVAARRLERHGGAVTRIVYYKLQTATLNRYVLVYLVANGDVTDIDLVED